MKTKELNAALRLVTGIDPQARWKEFEDARNRNHGRGPSLVESVFRAIHSGTEDFRKYELPHLPAWTLRIVHAKVSNPNSKQFSATKAKALEAAMRKAEATMCCPYCGRKFTASGLPSHSCHDAPEVPGEPRRHGNGARGLMAFEQAVARKRAGLAESVRLSRSAALEKPRACSLCGCIDLDCEECIRRTGEPCCWVGQDLCSACVGSESAGGRGPVEGQATKRTRVSASPRPPARAGKPGKGAGP